MNIKQVKTPFDLAKRDPEFILLLQTVKVYLNVIVVACVIQNCQAMMAEPIVNTTDGFPLERGNLWVGGVCT